MRQLQTSSTAGRSIRFRSTPTCFATGSGSSSPWSPPPLLAAGLA